MENLDANALNDANFIANTTYHIGAGTFHLEREIVINQTNVTFIGNQDGDPTVIYKHATRNGISVEQGGDGFCMKNIQMREQDNARENHGACLVIRANNTVVQDCEFASAAEKGTSFTVYYQGPHWTRENTIRNFNSNEPLHTGNKFIRNVVSSPRICHNLSFSLQDDGLVYDNTINGMLAVYMCKNTMVLRNEITTTNNHAIFVSTPSENIAILDNNLNTRVTVHSAILFKRQEDNNDNNRNINQPDSPINSAISNNTIRRKRCAIEFQVAHRALIYDNTYNPQQPRDDDGNAWPEIFRGRAIVNRFLEHVTILNNEVDPTLDNE